MPISPAHYRQHVGTYHHQRSDYRSGASCQRAANELAASLASNPPQRAGHPASVLWALALLQPQIHGVRNSRLRCKQQPASDCLVHCVPESTVSSPVLRPTILAVGPAASAREHAICSSRRVASHELPGRQARHEAVSRHQIPEQDHRPAAPALWHWPFAEAGSLPPASPELNWDEQRQFLVTRDEATKGEIIHRMIGILVEIGQISAEDADGLEFQWKHDTAGRALYVIPSNLPPAGTRAKRRSFKAIDDDIKAHIKRNCAFETEIVNQNGATEVEMKLFMLQQLQQQQDSPLLSMFQYLGSNSQLKPLPASLLKASDFILMFPVKDLHHVTIAALGEYYKRQYYLQTGDDICRIRQNRLALAEIATQLDIGGLGQFGKRIRKPVELMRSRALESDAIYFARNKQTGAQTELIMTARSGTPGPGSTSGQKDLLITSRSESSYVALERHPARTPRGEIPIVFDDAAEIWREAAAPHLPLLDMEFRSGHTFIKLHGAPYLLRMTAHNRYQVVLNHPNGIKEFIPLYRDRLTRTWHLETSNRNPIFSPAQAKIIERIKAPVDHRKHYEVINNDNPDCYGDGKFIKVSDKNNNAYHLVVEMKGELVPVRATHISHRGRRYDAYDYHDISKDGYPIEWDGERWRLESWTSAHASRELRQLVKPDMYVKNLDQRTLAATDERGIRWDSRDNGYIRIRKNFVQLFPKERSTLRTARGEPIPVRYENGQYYPQQVKPAAPAKVTKDGLITRSFSSLFAHALQSYYAPQLGKTNLYDRLVSLFQTNDIKAVEIPAATLDQRRIYFSIDGHEFIAETTAASKNISMLTKDAFEQAQEKLNARHAGGKIEQVLGLTQEEEHADGNAVGPASAAALHQLARKKIYDGARQIDDVLKRHLDKRTVPVLLVGNNDFFGTGSFSSSTYAPPASTYQALVDFFIPLSRNYSRVIIAPGTIYLSQAIPEAIRNSELSYEGHDSSGLVRDKVHFSTVIAPVFFCGKLVAIARKGEYLSYQDQHAAPASSDLQADHQRQSGPLVDIRLTDLDDTLPNGARLFVQDENQDSLSLPMDVEHHRRGTIFAGKTLLPEEHEQAEAILRPHMPNNSNNGDLFQSEFVIENEKFLLVIGNEYREANRSHPQIREQALSRDSTKIHGKRYDWILHLSAGQPLDQAMRSAGEQYLQVDSGEQNQYASDYLQRTHFMETEANSDLIVHNYRRDETN